MRHLIKQIFSLGLSVPLIGLSLITPAMAQEQSSMTAIPTEQATEFTQDIHLYPGRQSIINFDNGERIYFIQLADVTRVVFSTDVPIETGQAQTVLLRPIYPLRLERPALTSNGRYPTNITIGTISRKGRQLYTFDVVINSGHSGDDVDGINIDIPTPQPLPEPNYNQIALAGGRTATIPHVEIGVRVALRQGYTSINDPIMAKIDQFLAIARQNSTALPQVAQEVGINFEVITTLAAMGLEEETASMAQREEVDAPAPSIPK